MELSNPTPTIPTTPDSAMIMWAMLCSLLMPFATAFVNQPQWSKGMKVAMGLLVSCLMGAVTVGIQGKFDVTNWVNTTMLIAGFGTVWFRNWFKELATDLEVKTALPVQKSQPEEGG